MGDIIQFPQGGRPKDPATQDVTVGVANAILKEICAVHVEHRSEPGRLSTWLLAVEQFLIEGQELPRFVTPEQEARLIKLYVEVWREVITEKLFKK